MAWILDCPGSSIPNGLMRKRKLFRSLEAARRVAVQESEIRKRVGYGPCSIRETTKTESNLSRYDAGEFGLAPAIEQATPALVGGGTAFVTAAAARGFGSPGSWIERRAGTIGGVAGTVVALLAKQGGAAVAGALLVGLGIELIELLTEMKMEA